MATATQEKGIDYWLNLYNAAYRRIGEAETLGNMSMKEDCERLGDAAIGELGVLGVDVATLVRNPQDLTWCLPGGTVPAASM
jgi:hypothetical protein